jgi:hypothetical protein
MKRMGSLRFFTIQWKIAVARNDCAIFGKNLAMAWLGSLMVAPTPMKGQSHRGWNENEVTSSTSRIPILRRDWCQHPTNCITRAILAELRRHGLEVFERFEGKEDGTLWYYRTLVTAFRQHGDHADLIDEFDRVVSEIEKFVRER